MPALRIIYMTQDANQTSLLLIMVLAATEKFRAVTQQSVDGCTLKLHLCITSVHMIY